MVPRFGVSVLLVCGCIAMNAAPARCQALTEEAALARFDVESPALRVLAAQVQIARAEALRGRLLSNPSVTYSREDAAAAQDDFLLLQQSLPVSGRQRLARQAGDAAVRAAQDESEYARWSLRSNFRLAFYSLLLAQERKGRWERSVVNFQDVARILRDREREGEGSRFDRLRAERELADAEAQLAASDAQLSQAQAQLGAFLAPGADSSSLAGAGELPPDAAVAPLDALIERALARRGDRLAEQNHIERFDYERRAAERQKIPDPIVTGGLKHSRFQGLRDNGYQLGVTVPLPLFNRGQADAARARAASERSLAARQAIEQQIRSEVQGAYRVLQIRSRIAREYGRDLDAAAGELAQISRAAYQEGEQNILQLLDSHRVAVLSAIRNLELQSEARIARIELERAAGGEVMP